MVDIYSGYPFESTNFLQKWILYSANLSNELVEELQVEFLKIAEEMGWPTYLDEQGNQIVGLRLDEQ